MDEVVVFGSSGLVGTSLVEQLSIRNFNVLSPSSREVNLLSSESVYNYAQFLNGSKMPKTIIFTAAVVPYNAASHDDYESMFNNVVMANNLQKLCAAIPVKEIIYTSTLDVYQKNGGVLTEESPTGPSSNYGIFKLTAELLLRKFAAAYAIPFCCLRLSHIYGVNDKSPKVINKFFESAFQNSTITITGNKDALRDFIYVEDVSKVIVSCINKRINDTVNVATGAAITLEFLAKSIASQFTKPITINYREASTTETTSIQFDTAKLRKYYNGKFHHIDEVIPLIYERKKTDYIL